MRSFLIAAVAISPDDYPMDNIHPGAWVATVIFFLALVVYQKFNH